ncbi:MAG TPA: hypothetical protein VMW79_06130 [Anaerolineae bacterium]|nr:hypothetical protein [Anaerolineae bacterium]HUW95988.1 hypothetical protein [Anaerolineae bacterium]
MAVALTVTLKGPVFDNAPRKVQGAVTEILEDGVEAGEKHLDEEMLRKRPAGVFLAISTAEGGSVGNYRRLVQDKMVGHLHALITDGGSLYGPWLEGVGSRNATTRFKGYSSFRKTGQWLQKEIKGIANKALKRLMGRLN